MSTTTPELTQEEKRAKVAEACGWKETAADFVISPSGDLYDGYPNFFGSLDAMHEAEKTLSAEQREKYAEVLEFIMDSGLPGMVDCQFEATNWSATFALMHATAAQRAEAFRKTLNLW